MAEVLLFHHALGATPGIQAIADEIRASGHSVALPDLYDGATFTDLDAGIAHAGSIGFDTIIERGASAAAGTGEGLVVMGLSLGVLPAQKLAQTRAGVAGAVLCFGAIPLGVFADDWPDDTLAQLHMVEHDPFAEEDIDAAREIAAAAENGDLYVYPGNGHLVTDSSTPDYDPSAAATIMERTLALLATVNME